MNIHIESDNYFYKKGLEKLILPFLQKHTANSIFSAADGMPVDECGSVNIIFRESTISIVINHQSNSDCNIINSERRLITHIPFICKKRSLEDISWMIGKIFFIASLRYNGFVDDDFYQATGLKKHDQLSLTEKKILFLIGKGHDLDKISKHLHRSEKTIYVHCKNASRKMGIANKVDFYNYAKFFATCRKNERNTLCI